MAIRYSGQGVPASTEDLGDGFRAESIVQHLELIGRDERGVRDAMDDEGRQGHDEGPGATSASYSAATSQS